MFQISSAPFLLGSGDSPVKVHPETPTRARSSYISSHDALLGHHEDEADEDGRSEHADGAHQRVGALCLLAEQACGGCAYDHAQQTCHAGDGAKDQAGNEIERLNKELHL